MKAIFRLFAVLVVSAFFVSHSADAAWELVKAFAFGADTWTRPTYNVPSVQYIKIVSTGTAPYCPQYSADPGYGYTDSAATDESPNNRGVYSGDDEIYDQFIGGKLHGGSTPNPMLFRIDVDNGKYKFVAAGGDASNSNHGTIMRARDGDTATEIMLCSDFLPTANGQFWRCEFEGKVVPPASASPPTFPDTAKIECPMLDVTQGYITIVQQVGSHPDGNGADLCLLEVWLFKGATAGPDIKTETGQTVTLQGAGPADTTSWEWKQVIMADEPAVTIVDANKATCHFDAPASEVGYLLKFALTVISPTEGKTTDECLVYCYAPNPPRVGPTITQLRPRDKGFWISWQAVFDAQAYDVALELSPGVWFNYATDLTVLEFGIGNLPIGQNYGIKVIPKNAKGSGTESEVLYYRIMRNLSLPTGATPPTSHVSFGGGAVPAMNDGVLNVSVDSSATAATTEDFWGYTWGSALFFDRILYVTGQISSNGGWFTDLIVQYTQDGATWKNVPEIEISPPYNFTDSPTGRANFVEHNITFPVLRGTGIRIFGTPGGLATFTSIAELEVYGDQTRPANFILARGIDAQFPERSTAILDGTYSLAAAGPITSYQWERVSGPAVTLQNANTAQASFAAPGVEADTLYVFKLTVGDGTNTATDDDVRITVKNLITTAVAGPDQAVYEGTVATLNGIGSVTTSEKLDYSWVQKETGGTKVVLTGANTATPSFTAPAIWNYTEELVFELTVNDGVGGVNADSVTVIVKNPLERGIPRDPWGLTALDISGTEDNPNNIPGSSTYDPVTQTYTISADGEDVWDNDDGFRFLYEQVGSDFVGISLRIDPPPTTWPNAWTKVGVMVRQDLDNDSIFMDLLASRSNGMVQQYRTTKHGGAARQGGDAARQPYANGSLTFLGPVWLRLEREGDVWVGYYSYDGTEWVKGARWDYPAQHTIPFTAPFYAGIFVTSHDGGALATAICGDLRFKPALTDAYAIRTLPASYQAGGTADVSLSVRINPDNPPATTTVTENIPAGLSVVPGSVTHGGIVGADTVRWNFTAAQAGVTTVSYSLNVPAGTTAGVRLEGNVNGAKTFGDNVVYAVPSAPPNLGVEMLLAGHLSWSASSQEGVAGYRVYSSVDGAAWQEIAFVATTSYIDKWTEEGKGYRYKVAAVNVGGVEGSATVPTDEARITMELREAENFNFGGGQWPGYQNCPAATEATAADQVQCTNDYWHPNTGGPRDYRPNDAIGIETVEEVDRPGTFHTNIGWIDAGSWYKYTFNVPVAGPGDPPGGWIKLTFRVASPSGGVLAAYWDGNLIGTTSYVTGNWHIFTYAPMEEQIQTSSGIHVLRVESVSGQLNLDTIGIGFNWTPPRRQAIFEDEFESYTNLYSSDDIVASGNWTVQGIAGALGAWRLWITTGDDLGDESADIADMDNKYAIIDSDLAGDVDADEQLITKEIDCTEWIRLRLNFSRNYRAYLDDITHAQTADVDIRVIEGVVPGSWVNLMRWEKSIFAPGTDPAVDSGREQVDLSAYDGKKIQLRWHYYNARYDYWFAVDNVKLSGERKELPRGAIQQMRVVAGKVELSWSAFGPGNYTVEYTDDIVKGDWKPVTGTWPSTLTTWPGEATTGIKTRFYRVRSQ